MEYTKKEIDLLTRFFLVGNGYRSLMFNQRLDIFFITVDFMRGDLSFMFEKINKNKIKMSIASYRDSSYKEDAIRFMQRKEPYAKYFKSLSNVLKYLKSKYKQND